MDKTTPTRQNRRAFLRACLAMPAMYILAGCAGEVATSPPAAPPTAAEPVEEPATTTQIAEVTEAPAPTQPTIPEPVATQVAQTLAPTPACDDGDDDITPAQAEGPYYTPNTPERTSLLE